MEDQPDAIEQIVMCSQRVAVLASALRASMDENSFELAIYWLSKLSGELTDAATIGTQLATELEEKLQ
jgi:hypothetical protein